MAGNARALRAASRGQAPPLVDGGGRANSCLPRVPGQGMSGRAEVYRPLADGEIVCTSPSLGSTVGAGGSVNVRSNRLCRACTKRRSTLPERGQAIG